MATLPQSNARLLSVTRGEFTEDYDRDASQVPPIWQGEEEAYLQQKIRSLMAPGGALRRVLDVTLIVSEDLPVVLQAGDTLQYQGDSDPAPVTGRIQNFINPAELAYLPDYYKCALEDTNAP